MRVAGAVIHTERVQAAAITWSVRRGGEGPPVLLLHGFPESADSWRHNVGPLIEAGHEVLVPDLKGYGETDKPRPGAPIGGDYRLSAMSAEIGELIAALGHSRVDVVGHDWGGVLLSAMMVTARERIDRAVLLNAPFRRFVFWSPRHIYFFNLPDLPERRFYREPMGFIGDIFDRWSYNRGACTHEDLRRYVRAFQEGGSITCAFAYYRSLRRDLPFILRARAMKAPEGGFPPTLICFGAKDPIMPARVAKMAHADIPGSRLELIEDAGHFVHSEAADRVNALLVEHLAR